MASKEWKEYKLKDVCIKITDGVHNTVKDDIQGECYLLSCKNLKNNQIVISPQDRKISFETLQRLRQRTETQKGDVLLSSVGTIGETAIIKEFNPNYEFQRSVAILKPNTSMITSEYLFYFLNNSKRKLQHSAEGAVQQCLFINPLKEFKIDIPPTKTQQKIAKVLSAIDDKIELNNSINNNLEQQAQAIFKQIFSDISEDDLPSNWHKGTIGEIVELHDSKRVPLSGQQREKMKQKIYPYYGATSLMDYVDDYIFDGIYLLLGEDGTVIDTKGFPILQYVWGKFWVNNHAHILTGKNGFNVESLYLLFRQLSIKSIVTGAVQAKISQANLKSLEVIIPPIEVIENLNDKIKPFFYQIRSNLDENKVLTQLRDTLLPKLMNGEIDVSEVDISTDKLLFSEDKS